MKINWKSVLNYGLPVLLFVVIAYAYFSPLLEGKTLTAHDLSTSRGMSKELVDYRNETGKEALWTNSMFGGMPAYMISTRFTGNLVVKLNKILLAGKRPASYLILWFLSFYVLLLVMGVNPWLSFAGALVYGLTSNFFVLVGAGHMSKVHTLGYVPFVLAGIILAFRQRRLLGAAIMGLALSLMISANHPQMTFYTFLIVLVLGIVYLIESIKKKELTGFFKTIGILAIAVVLAVGANFSRLYTTFEYMKYSTRGKTELASIPDENKTGGLNRDYITDWSYGLGETFTLIIPNFRGGKSGGFDNHRKTETYKVMKQKGLEGYEQKSQQVSSYWGPQMVTSGPTYVGAMVCFLFVLGLFLIKGKEKWWLGAITLLAIMLSWGKFFPFLTDLFIDYFPYYNKFRDVTMILVIVHITMPFLGILAVKEVVDGNVSKKDFMKSFWWALGLTGGFSLLMTIMPGLAGDFLIDYELTALPDWLQNAAIADRKSLLSSDALRSLALIAAGAVLLWAGYFKKLKWQYVFPLLALFFIVDMWPVGKRYLNNDKFVTPRKAKTELAPSAADKLILNDKELDYRVLNLSVSPWMDASTSYFHKSIGGYHGAKMLRYNELISYVISPELQNMQKRFQSFNGDPSTIFTGLNALNMLNTKYVIYNPQAQPLPNPLRLGNAWCVPKVRFVENADKELNAIKNFDPKAEAIVDERFKDLIPGNYSPSSSGNIRLTSYVANNLVYEFEASEDQLVVFSEIYYSKGWKVYIDDKEAEHFRTNYVLRGMHVPAGKHKIVFNFHPESYYMGNKVSYASSALFILMILGVVFMELRKKK